MVDTFRTVKLLVKKKNRKMIKNTLNTKKWYTDFKTRGKLKQQEMTIISIAHD